MSDSKRQQALLSWLDTNELVFSEEAVSFILNNNLEASVETTLNIAKNYFKAFRWELSVLTDPESADQWLVLDASLDSISDPVETTRVYFEYGEDWINRVKASDRDLITLTYTVGERKVGLTCLTRDANTSCG